MDYEPHTARVDADGTVDLPPTAVGLTVDREEGEYVVHYLALTEDAQESRREEVREIIDRLPDTENVEIRG